MENEIKVGDYCRTSAGKIFKCSEIVLGNIPKDENKTMIVQYIVKHSPKLIDLICEGDYVNGRKIERIVDISHKHNSIIVVYDGELWNEEIMEEDIENIVTKEQFESISYKVTKM